MSRRWREKPALWMVSATVPADIRPSLSKHSDPSAAPQLCFAIFGLMQAFANAASDHLLVRPKLLTQLLGEQTQGPALPPTIGLQIHLQGRVSDCAILPLAQLRCPIIGARSHNKLESSIQEELRVLGL